MYVYIYIYDISSLRVNDLTLILLTWRKWWAPNNASKQQMGFNSEFKGLMPFGKETEIHVCTVGRQVNTDNWCNTLQTSTEDTIRKRKDGGEITLH